MDIGQFRDLVIVISGILFIIISIAAAVFLILAFRSVNKILKSTRATMAKVEELATIATDEIGKPMLKAAGFMQGAACGFRS